MKVLITGGSGFLGQAFSKRLIESGCSVSWLSSNPAKHKNNSFDIPVYGYDDLTNLFGYDAVINLAGAGIADKPWSDKRKRILESSRIDTTQHITDWIQSLQNQKKTLPSVLISGSAIGWYGVQGDKALTEASEPVYEYQHQLCERWEQIALQLKNKVRTVIVRTGVVLDDSGGMLAKIKMPFSLGLGGRLGDGKQYFSWISLDDWVEACYFLLTHQTQSGIYNLTAPQPVTNAEFTKSFATYLKRPAFFHVPAFVLKSILGEMSTLLINGQKVVPKRLLSAGYEFKHPNLASFFDINNS